MVRPRGEKTTDPNPRVRGSSLAVYPCTIYSFGRGWLPSAILDVCEARGHQRGKRSKRREIPKWKGLYSSREIRLLAARNGSGCTLLGTDYRLSGLVYFLPFIARRPYTNRSWFGVLSSRGGSRTSTAHRHDRRSSVATQLGEYSWLLSFTI